MKCRVCGKNYNIETCCVFSNYIYDEETREWVSFQGFIERTGCCHHPLGDGYGDANYFETREEAKKDAYQWSNRIGKWF